MPDPPPTLGIQEAARHLGVSPHTLRYYDRESLLDVPRSAGGDRRYTTTELNVLKFLIYLRGTGMNMAGLRRYAALLRAGDATMADRRAQLAEHEAQVARQLDDMTRALAAIRTKIGVYDRLLTPDPAAPPSPFPPRAPLNGRASRSPG